MSNTEHDNPLARGRHQVDRLDLHALVFESTDGVRRLLGLAWLALVLGLLAGGSAQAARLALVIGNKDYTVGALKNPINDAEAVATVLGGRGGLGFQVTLIKNLRRDDVGRTVDGFAGRIRPGDDVVVFYAGHGVQVKGVNFLPAVDANIRAESDVALNSLNLNQLLERLDEAKAGVRLLLIDACRDNPYSRSLRGGNRGLARIEGAPSGTLMHFATRPGGVAADGTGNNGLYTSHLLQHLRTPGVPVESMLKRVAADVRKASGGDQQPWTEGALDGEFYFASAAASGPTPVAPRPELLPAPAQPVTKPVVAPVAATATKPNPTTPTPVAGQTIKDCSECPELVVLPKGKFLMGSPDTEKVRAKHEGPVHEVRIDYALAVGKYAVTFDDWDACVNAGKCTHSPSDQGWGRGRRPAIFVTWDDAQQYVKWLSLKTGKAYRLLSEAEWEYAARAGSNTAYPWGNEIGRKNANCIGCGSQWDNKQTAPVGQFAANGFGLYDMNGNVWQWVQDIPHADYSGAPSDGSAWTTGGNQAQRVLRGGSWYSTPRDLRSATRSREAPTNSNHITGLRIGRAL